MAKHASFSIGDWVSATHYVELVYETDAPPDTEYHKQQFERRIRRIENAVLGQIVGGVYRPLGQLRHGYSYGTMDGYEESPPYLEVKLMVFMYLIREGFTNNPKECLLGDISPIEPPKAGMRMRKCSQPQLDDKYRKLLSEFAKEMDRTPDGRFVKYTKAPVGKAHG